MNKILKDLLKKLKDPTYIYLVVQCNVLSPISANEMKKLLANFDTNKISSESIEIRTTESLGNFIVNKTGDYWHFVITNRGRILLQKVPF